MTYPPQQYQPQPSYPQPQYGAPQGTPWMPQQYGGAPSPVQQQTAPPMGGQALPTQAPALGVGSRSGDGGPKVPQPRHLIGRTVIFEPIRIDETTKNDDGELRPTAYYHLTVVDGGPLEYGDNKSQKIADQHGLTMRTEVPARFVNVSSDRWGIVQEVRDAMARGDLATVGVIEQGTRGTKGSPPFLVTKPGTTIDGKERPDGDRRFALATQVWNDVFAKTFRSPEPVSLVAPPASQPPQVAYQPTAAGYAAAQQGITQPYPYGGAAQQLAQHGSQAAADLNAAYANLSPVGYQPQQYAAPAPASVQQPAMDPGYAAYLAAQQAAAAPPQSAPPVDPQYAAWLASQQGQQPAGPGI